MNGLSKEYSGTRFTKPFLDGILNDLMVIISNSEGSNDEYLEQIAVNNSIVINNNLGIALIMQYFIPNNDQVKGNDINQALVRNLKHRAITDIYLLNEKEYDYSKLFNHEKIHQIIIKERLTFKIAFSFANKYLLGRTVLLGISFYI